MRSRVTQDVLEVLAFPPAWAEITQEALEVLVSPFGWSEVTQEVLEVLVLPDGWAEVTQAALEVLVYIGPPPIIRKGYIALALGGDGDQCVSGSPDGQGNWLAGVSYFSLTGDDFIGTIRLTASGVFDTSFGTSGLALVPHYPTSTHEAVLVQLQQAGGKLVLGGYFCPGGGQSRWGLVRVKADGSLDTTFGVSGYVLGSFPVPSLNESVVDIDQQPDGKLLVFGSLFDTSNKNHLTVIRYSADGIPDNTFGTAGVVVVTFPPPYISGIAAAALLLANGKLVLTGKIATASNVSYFGLTRLNGDGSIDTSYGTAGYTTTTITPPANTTFGATLDAVLLSGDKALLCGGLGATNQTTLNGLVLARYNADGTLDTTFGTAGILIYRSVGGVDICHLDRMCVQGSKVLLGGSADAHNPLNGGTGPIFLIRIDFDGSVDTTFGTAGVTTFSPGGLQDDYCLNVVVQPDGSILMAGYSYDPQFNAHGWAARLSPDGALNPDFGDQV